MITALETKIEQIIIGGIGICQLDRDGCGQFWKDNPFLFWEIEKG
jgi:hypothetical protein